MKIVVTGRIGQLVRSLVEAAGARTDVEVVTAGRPEMDLGEPTTAAAHILSFHPDVVINAAAYTAVDAAEDDQDEARRINAAAPEALAAATARSGVRFVQISTDYVYDGLGEGAYDEQTPPAPLGVYGRTKLEGELRALAANPETVILRTAWVYSPFGRNFLRTMMALAQVRRVLTVVGDQNGSPSYAPDLATAILALTDRWRNVPTLALGQAYHVAGSGSTSWAGFAECIMRECAANGLASAEVRPIRTEDWPTKAVRPRNSVLDCAKFARDVGYAAPVWQDSTRRAVARIAAEHIVEA